MSRITTLAVAAAALFALTIVARPSAWQSPSQTPLAAAQELADRDEDFIKNVGQASQIEIESSQLAIVKATNAEVRAFAQKLVDEHTKTSAELMGLVRTKNAMWKADDPAWKERKTKHESLQTKSGADFDKEYLQDMINDHESTIARFARHKQYGKDPSIKSFADKALPVLQEHLKMARELRAKLFKDK